MVSTKSETIVHQNFELGKSYSRQAIAEIGLVTPPHNSRAWTGIVEFQNCIVLFVTLDKSNRELNLQYSDYFDNEERILYWDSQNRSTQSTPVIERIIDQHTVILFARLMDKNKGKTQPFLYIGNLLALDYEDEKPVQFVFELADHQANPSPDLLAIYSWKPPVPQLEKQIQTAYKHSKEKIAKMGSRGQGRLIDSEKKKAIELWAMRVASEHYSTRVYSVQDTSANQPYDLVVSNNIERRKVEVKGTTGGCASVSVTANEVASAWLTTEETDLFVVSEIKIIRQSEAFMASAGKITVIANWLPDKNSLTATAFTYRLP